MTVDIELQNEGEPQDVVVSTVVSRYGTGEPVAGLLLSTLTELTGAASFSPRWNSTGAPAGLYDVEVTLRDMTGNLLDRESQRFQVGVAAGEIVSFTTTPEELEPGQTIDITMAFSNSGTVEITGTAVIRVLNGGGGTVAEFSHGTSALPPGLIVAVDESWDTDGVLRGTYGVVSR